MQKPERSSMTLDQAQKAFAEADGPNARTMADLLMTALEYWHDGLIDDEALADIVAEMARDLRETI